MDRRKFLATSVASTITGQSALTQVKGRPETSSAAQASIDQISAFELDELSISDLQERLKSGSFTSQRIVELYLQRIGQIDRQGPALRSIIEINPDALATARSLDAEYQAKGPRGPLHGIPVLLKDNIDTADRMQTTAGSLALEGEPASQDAWLVRRLRSAGAVMLGKTNLSEWANFRSTHSTSGWSGRGGQTKNPYALDRNPCGSSSGSGVAISASLCTVAVGTETDGSIVCPASMCGIVGVKSTVGLISRSGIIPIAHSQDTPGPMARSVRDAAMLLNVLAAPDPRDGATQASIGQPEADYTKFLDPDGLRGAKIGVARQYFGIHPRITAIVESCIDLIRRCGAQIVDPVELPSYQTWRETETEVLLYEFKADLNAYLTTRNAGVKSLANCIAFNRAHRAQEMPYFEQELMEQAQAKGSLTEKAYRDALATNKKLTRKQGIDAVLQKAKLDALIGPTAGPAWLTDWVNGDQADSGCASPPAVAGYPHITVPAGFHFGLPVGLSFFGTAWSEPKLIRYAYAFEQASKARRKPGFLPTVDVSV